MGCHPRISYTNESALGVDGALELARRVLDIVKAGGTNPILVLFDSTAINEYPAHLAKALLLAEAHGHRTAGLLYSGSATGAFITTAFAMGTLVGLPGARPPVMDLPSMAGYIATFKSFF